MEGKGTERKWRLFACACCRQIWQLLTDSRYRNAVECSEKYADGFANSLQLSQARNEAFLAEDNRDHLRNYELAAPRRAAEPFEEISGGSYQASLLNYDVCFSLGEKADRMHSTLVKDIFGHQFWRYRIAIEQAWRSWNDGIVVKLAQSIYDERQLPSGHLDQARLAILADALEDAGCTTQDILSHCRGPGPHVRGCWVIDLLLGKE